MICTTKYIGEYRYEVGFLIPQAVQWYRSVAILRGTGQAYYYLHILMLLVFCYKVTPATHPQRSPKHLHVVATRCYKSCILFLKAPVQSVIFGSPFPIFCYACAHVIDASASCEILGNIFNSAGGVFQLKFRDLLTVGFNQMRSVWLLAFVLHTSILFETSRRGLSWAPVSGIRGVPEFMLSGLSSVTIMAQFRSTKFRNTKIYSIFEITESSTVQTVRSQQSAPPRGSGTTILGGFFIDVKIFACVLAVLFGIFVLRNGIRFGKSLGNNNHKARVPKLQTRTPVSYSAGVLWPVGSMCVLWTSDYFCVKSRYASSRYSIKASSKKVESKDGESEQESKQESDTDSRDSREERTVSSMGDRSLSRRSFTSFSSKIHDVIEVLPSVLMTWREFRSLQHQMESLHNRGDEVEATIAFMNLVTMSDPIVYFCYVMGGVGGKRLGYYQSLRDPEKYFLLPQDAIGRKDLRARELKLIYSVNSPSLCLTDLIHCG
ncbi:hypothetical protein FI667_g9606, partial [Globisporangium splendens]